MERLYCDYCGRNHTKGGCVIGYSLSAPIGNVNWNHLNMLLRLEDIIKEIEERHYKYWIGELKYHGR